MREVKTGKLLWALVLGVLAGLLFHPFLGDPRLTWIDTHVLAPAGQIFLRMIFMVVVPLVFSSLILGVYELGLGEGLGRVARRTLLFTLLASTVSVLIGVGLVNTIRPGDGFFREGTLELSGQAAAVATIQSNATKASPLSTTLVELIPKNPLDSATRALSGEMLQLIVFALIFGFALSAVRRGESRASVVVALLQEVFSVCMRVIGYAMHLAPIGIFAIVFGTVFRFGYGVLWALGLYVGTVVLGLLIQQFGVYSLLLKLFTKRSPLKFFAACREMYLYAFSTASSNATLPLAIHTAENRLGLSPRVSRFVLTVGSTANQNGTALFEGVTVLFLAQVYGIDLMFHQQLQVVAMSIIAGIGTAGVPGGSLPLIMILLTQVGIPAEGMGLILGADRFLDMCRTTLNVSGDVVMAALVNDASGEEEVSVTQVVAVVE